MPTTPDVDLPPVYYYSSSSGQTRTFAESLGCRTYDLSDAVVRRSAPSEPWVLITPSYKSGNDDQDTIPEPVRRFLSNPLTRRWMVAVMGSTPETSREPPDTL